MAGIYIHIPFCKKACHYCDFHFSTSLRQKEKVVHALQKEIELRKHYLADAPIETIYLGGGTPSLLSPDELSSLFESIHRHFTVIESPEITLEANPDDLTASKIKELAHSPINRLSIGIQSFRDEDLKWMNRAHHANQAKEAVKSAQNSGFDNITIDLIYGLPHLDEASWKANLQQAFELNIQHISAYCLTVEPGTALGYNVSKGKSKDVDDDLAGLQFELMLDMMNKHGFEQYEISNFAKNECYSRHNSNYWNKTHYLGIGPSAHSFDGTSRAWNIANNKKYCDAIFNGKLAAEQEELDLTTRYNEHILTGLRTKWGVNLSQIKKYYGEDFQNFLLNSSSKFISSKLIERSADSLLLTEKGKLFVDKIASDLFMVNE